MSAPNDFLGPLSGAWDVFVLFAIPIGGGIPAGVLLARSRGIGWGGMSALYFVSDVALACCFEPLMRLIVFGAKRSLFLARVRDAYRRSLAKTQPFPSTRMGPLALVGVSLGVDPMTGRAAAAAAGHGFVSGWALAIAGDMIYFALIMGSTLWLNGILGDGTWTTVIILGVMMVVPAIVRRWRAGKSPVR